MTELAAQPIRRATSFKENFAPSSFSARLRRSESSSAEPFGRMGTSYRQEVHYCIILCEINKAIRFQTHGNMSSKHVNLLDCRRSEDSAFGVHCSGLEGQVV